MAVVSAADRPFIERGRDWDLTRLPVPAEILIYTEPEWDQLQAGGGHMATALATETIWMVDRPPPGRNAP